MNVSIRRLTSAPRRPVWFLAGLLLLGLLALPYVFFDGFSGLQLYDDEGTLMITVRDLQQGLRLYDDSYGLYGPFYYLTIGGLYTKLHIPLVHDSARAISSIFRLLAAGLLGALTFRLSRSILCGVFASFALLILYRFMSHSATHPQELCLLLVAGVPHLLLSRDKASPRMALLLTAGTAGCVAALLLTKINIGAFAMVALVLTVLRAAPDTGIWRRLTGLAALLPLLLPLLLMLPLLRFAWAELYCASATITLAATLLTWFGSERQAWLTPGGVLAGLAGGMAVAVATLGATLAGGSSPYAILSGVVLQNGHFARNFYIAMPHSAASIVTAPAALVLALLIRRVRSRPDAAMFIAACKLAVGAGGILCLLPMLLGLPEPWDARLAAFQLVTPFAFLILLPADRHSPLGAGRMSFGLLATFTVLYAFPVASDQIAFAATLSVAALPLLFREGLLGMAPLLARAAPSRRAAAVSGWLVVALCCGGLLQQTRQAWWIWGGSVSSDLPGASLIHVSPAQRAVLHWAVQQVAACPAFYTFPNVMSFYLWTHRPSPTRLTNNDTIGLLTEAQQDEIVADLTARQQGLCVIYLPGLLQQFDRGQIAARPPLLRYLQDNYAEAGHLGPYELLTRKAP